METYREQMQRDMVLRNLVAKTQYMYHNAARKLEDHFGRPPDQLNEDEVKSFLISIVEDRKLSQSSLKITYSALRFPSLRADRLSPSLQLQAEKGGLPGLDNIFVDLKLGGDFYIQRSWNF